MTQKMCTSSVGASAGWRRPLSHKPVARLLFTSKEIASVALRVEALRAPAKVEAAHGRDLPVNGRDHCRIELSDHSVGRPF